MFRLADILAFILYGWNLDLRLDPGFLGNIPFRGSLTLGCLTGNHRSEFGSLVLGCLAGSHRRQFGNRTLGCLAGNDHREFGSCPSKRPKQAGKVGAGPLALLRP